MRAESELGPSRGVGRGSPPAAWIGLPLILMLAGPPLPAATITVDKSDSSHAEDGACSLREAIDSANDDLAPYSASGECAPGSGADTIVLTGDVQLDADPYAGSGLPYVTSRITLDGNGREIRRASAGPAFRFLVVFLQGDLTVERATLVNGDAVDAGGFGGAIASWGRLTLIDSRLLENHASYGGAIYTLGALVLRESELRDNEADTRGGALYIGGSAELIDSLVTLNAAPTGGGIRAEDADLTLVRTTVSDNLATWGGGLAVSGDGLTTLVESSVDSNAATSAGGGINALGRVRIVDSTLSDNTAGSGGGLTLHQHAHATITRSTLSDNQATTLHGGAVFSSTSSVVSLVNSTLSGNSAADGGGGVYTEMGTVTLDYCTLMGNSTGGAGSAIYNQGGDVTVTASILHDLPAGHNCGGPTPVIDGGHNFVNDSSCPWPLRITTIDPNLADHGGPTETHVLYQDSDARNRVHLCPPLTDQRGALRDLDCDSGAFEHGVNDRYEWPPGDDDCPGRPIQLGVAEHHLHYAEGFADPDWVWFRPTQVGARYEIQTRNLHDYADTTLQLYQGCSTPGGFDDDGGDEPFASKLTHDATAADVERGRVDVVIREKNDSYTVGEGYDVVVTCLSGCPSCTASGGPAFDLAGENLVGFRLIEACDKIRVEETRIWPGGLAILRSGGTVELRDGFRVDAGGGLVATTD